MGSQGALPYWNVNVPEDEHTVECPDFLKNMSEKDREIISTPDSKYRAHTWDEVREISCSNDLQLFQRVPSELRRYRAYTWRLTRDYGSVENFILHQRLGWEAPVRAKGRPFEFQDDYKILHNDWPYGVDPRIVHLVVWTKFPLEEDPISGRLTKESYRAMKNFMAETFEKHVPSEHVIWFKNWTALKSVNGVEHFHVMMWDPDPEFVKRITNGDIPQCSKPAP